MKALFDGYCNECHGKIISGEEIVRTGGRWIHEQCQLRSNEASALLTNVETLYKKYHNMDETTYSVTTSRASACTWALKEGLIEQGDYDKLYSFYRQIWHYVSD